MTEVIIVVLIIAFIISLFAEKFNAIYCILLGIVSFFITSGLCAVVKEDATKINTVAILFAVMVAGWYVVRSLPAIVIAAKDEETSTYLILGTLVEETDNGVNAMFLCLVIIGIVATVLGIGTAFLMTWALEKSLYFIGYLLSVILTIWGVFSTFKAFTD